MVKFFELLKFSLIVFISQQGSWLEWYINNVLGHLKVPGYPGKNPCRACYAMLVLIFEQFRIYLLQLNQCRFWVSQKLSPIIFVSRNESSCTISLVLLT